jgi:tetratricopeptide (TPR) repeat protein
MRLESTEGEVKLSCEEFDVDVPRFRELLKKADDLSEERFELLKQAESSYKGDLLEDRLEEWCEEERRSLRNMYTRLLKNLATTSKEIGHTALALQYIRKLVELEPLDEDAQRELMVLLHLSGRRAEALAQFEVLRQLLRRELGVSPTDATLQVWQHVRSSPTVETRGLSVGGRDASGQPHKLGSIPMVGRADLVSDLISSMDVTAHAGGAAFIVSGEPGVGKSKLVEVVLVEAELRGFEILYGQCPDLRNPAPYHVFIQALWPRIHVSKHQGGGVAAPIGVLLRTISPDSSEKSSTWLAEPVSKAYDGAIIVEGFLSMLGGSNSERPTLLVLEDMHRIDGASANLLVTLLGRLAKRKLFVLITMRSDESEARNTASVLIAGGAREIQLKPLSEEEVGKLVRLALGSNSVSGRVLKHVWEKSNGIPLFALEFLKYLQTEGMIQKVADRYWVLSEKAMTAETSGGIPSRLHEILRRRIETLDSGARRVLLTAAAFGADVHVEILKELVDVSEDSFIEAVERLVNLRLLQETEQCLRFSHEMVRVVAASMVGKTRLRIMHSRIGKLLERGMPWRVEDLAHHFEMGGNVLKALAYAEASGDKAKSIHANADAATWYSKALNLQDRGYPENAEHLRLRADLLWKRQDVLDLLGDRERQAADIAAIQALALRLEDKRMHAESLYLRANLLIRANAADDALNCVRLANRYFGKIGDRGGAARSHETIGLAYENLRQYSLASVEFKRAQEMFRQVRDREGEARSLFHIGVYLGHANRDIDALRYLNKAGDLLERLGDRRYLALVFVQKWVLLRFLGRLGASESLLLRGISTSREIGDRIGEARGLGQLANTHAAMGRLRDAVHESKTALAIARQMKDVRALVMILNNSAYAVHRLTGSFSHAKWYVSEALRLVSEAGNVENSAPYEDTMAAVLIEAGHAKEALRWARRSEVRCNESGSRTWVGIDIKLRLGSILAELGRPREALRYVKQSQRLLGKNREPGSELLIATVMARLFLALGDLNAASECERRISSLLRQIDGVEQIQKIYWAQYCVFKALGRNRAAKRALSKAAAITIRQAGTLRKPMRKRFLATKVNSEILREFWNSNRYLAAGNTIAEVTAIADVLAKSKITAGWNLTPLRIERGSNVEFSSASILTARRGVVLERIQEGRLKQKELANMLGVSSRTIRNDITRLREQGMLGARLVT